MHLFFFYLTTMIWSWVELMFNPNLKLIPSVLPCFELHLNKSAYLLLVSLPQCGHIKHGCMHSLWEFDKNPYCKNVKLRKKCYSLKTPFLEEYIFPFRAISCCSGTFVYSSHFQMLPLFWEKTWEAACGLHIHQEKA